LKVQWFEVHLNRFKLNGISLKRLKYHLTRMTGIVLPDPTDQPPSSSPVPHQTALRTPTVIEPLPAGRHPLVTARPPSFSFLHVVAARPPPPPFYLPSAIKAPQTPFAALKGTENHRCPIPPFRTASTPIKSAPPPFPPGDFRFESAIGPPFPTTESKLRSLRSNFLVSS
jgi:hypothetical protein